MNDLIIISGAPGSGKSSVCQLLNEKFSSAWIDYGRLREFHLDREWKKANEKEEEMTFENLISIITNYIKRGYKNIIVDDLQDFRVSQLQNIFPNSKIFTLCPEDLEIEKRIKLRNDGWKNVEDAIKWNQQIRERDFKNEYKIDNTNLSPEGTLKKILKILNS